MIITNKYGHPQTLVDAVQRALDSYDPGSSWMSLTSLVGKGPRLVAYERGREEWTQVDIDELLHSFVGTVVHDALERASMGIDHNEQEHRVYWELAGKLISGQFDELDKRASLLRDWKTTSVWSFALGGKGHAPPWVTLPGVELQGIKPDWVAQTNGLKYLIDKNIENPHPETGAVDLESPAKLEIFAILTDHSRSKAGQGDYPETKGHSVSIPVWSPETTEQVLLSRIERHAKYEGMSPEEIPECSPDEMWQRDSVFAVHTPGRKSSHRNLSSRVAAELYIEEKELHKKRAEIIERPGVKVRCAQWCPARHVCPVGIQENS